MIWWSVGLRALIIFSYFVIATVWWPSWLARLDAVASAASWVRDTTVASAWTVALVAGIIGLRSAQQRGWI